MLSEIIDVLQNWKAQNKPAALATVVQTWGSSPRPAGAHMLVSADGAFEGSVSGGCVESAVIQESLTVIQTQTAKKLHFGVSDQSAWEVGLACGGKLDVFITPVDWQALSPILSDIAQDKPTWYSITLDETGKIEHTSPLEPDTAYPVMVEEAGTSTLILYDPPAKQLFVVGGVNISQILVKLAKLMDYHVILIDPRKSFAAPERFPEADIILNDWPEEAFQQKPITTSSAVVMLTHDDKIDLPALQIALRSPAFYVGALGSNKTQSRRKEELAARGITSEQLARIHGPIGLDIHARQPNEIALAIMAEIIAASGQN